MKIIQDKKDLVGRTIKTISFKYPYIILVFDDRHFAAIDKSDIDFESEDDIAFELLDQDGFNAFDHPDSVKLGIITEEELQIYKENQEVVIGKTDDKESVELLQSAVQSLGKDKVMKIVQEMKCE